MAPPSAFIGQPPLTDDDYWIVRGMQLTAGLSDPHPQKGIKLSLQKPPPGQYHFETKGPQIIAGSAVAIALMFLFTATRIMIRCSKKRAYFGKDDWFIIPGCVSSSLLPSGGLHVPADQERSFLPHRGPFCRLPPSMNQVLASICMM